MRAVTPGDPTAVTRRSYDLVAADYAARNATPTPDFATWRDEWVLAVHDFRARRDGAARGGSGVAPRVLDAGAGPGQYSATFAAAGLHVTALDLSPAMADLARARGVPVVLGDLRRPPFTDATFDGVWSAAALLHVPRDDVPATVREWRRVTLDGGHLALATASGGTDGWEESPYATPGDRPAPRWFVFHDTDGLTALLGSAGWRVESVTRHHGQREWLMVRAVAT